MIGGLPAKSVPTSAPVPHPPGGGQLENSARSQVQFVTALKPVLGRWPDPSSSSPYERTSGLC